MALADRFGPLASDEGDGGSNLFVGQVVLEGQQVALVVAADQDGGAELDEREKRRLDGFGAALIALLWRNGESSTDESCLCNRLRKCS